MLEKKSSRYRKIECRMWGDDKFCSLSPIQPSGQALWIYLLTGPHTNLIPGLFRSGKAAMAENLEWPLEAFLEAFQEVFREGMAKGDWKAKVVWVQNAIFCNKPASSNVVLSWSTEWDLIPECELKLEAYDFLESAMGGFGQAFLDAFRKACRKPSGNPPRNQEQEQDQEQHQEQKLSQILLFNVGVVERHNVDVNIEECSFPLILDTSTGELVRLDSLEEGMPRIEVKVPKIDEHVQMANVQIEHVQNGSKLVQKVQIEPIGEHFQIGYSPSKKFQRFWDAYPRKQAKKKTHDIWKRKKLDIYIDIILEDLAQRKDWNAGSQFTPLPTTYLNGERWQDEEKNERKEVKQPNKSITEILEEKYKLEEELTNKMEKEQ